MLNQRIYFISLMTIMSKPHDHGKNKATLNQCKTTLALVHLKISVVAWSSFVVQI